MQKSCANHSLCKEVALNFWAWISLHSVVGWPCQQSNTHPHSSLLRWVKNRRQTKRLMDQDNDSLNRVRKSCSCKQGMRNLLTTTQSTGRCLATFLESSACVSWEDKHHNHKCPSLPFPGLLLITMISSGVEYPFGQFRLAVLAVSSLNLLPTPSLLAIVRGR